MSGLKRGAGVLACLLPAVLLTALLSRMILQAWGPESSLTFLLILSLVLVIPVGLLLRRDGLALLGVLLALLPGLAVCFLCGFSLERVAGDAAMAAVLVLGPTAAMVAGFSAKRVILPPLVILTAGVWIITAALGRSLTMADVSLAMVALMAFTARSALHRWNTLPTPQAEGTLAGWVLPVAAAMAVVVWAVFAPYTQLPRSEKLHQKLEFIQEMIQNLMGEPEPRTSFSLVDTGMRPDVSYLGGPAILSELPTLKVKVSDTGLLLRGAVFQDYNGHTWSNSQPTHRYAMTEGEVLTRVFDLDLPENCEDFREVSAEIALLEDGTASLFVPYRVNAVQPASVLTMMAYFNDRGEVFNAQDMKKGLAYTVKAKLPDLTLDDLAARSGLVASGPVDGVYTALPRELPDSVRAFAEKAAAGAANDAQRVKLLAEAVARTMTYTLTPETPPRDRDFVDYALESGEGYCTYYATAMAVLARTLGIPSRYVEGYNLPKDARAGEEIILTEAESHAWCEVYLPDFGWYPVDATQVEGSAMEQEAKATPTPTPTPTPRPTPTPEQEKDPPKPTPTPPPPQAPKLDWKWLKKAGWVLLALVLAALVIFLPPWIFKMREKRLSETAEGAMTAQLRAIARLLAYLGLKPKPGETANRFALRVDEAFPADRITGRDLAELINRLYFAPRGQVTPGDLRTAQRYRAFLDRTLRQEKGALGYALREKYRILRP